jgi:hypothetical protein
MSIDYLKIKASKKYRLIRIPPANLKIDVDGWPALGVVGECKWTSSMYGACMDFGGEEVIIPFDCLEEHSSKTDGIEDAILVSVVLDNPQGVLKILKGLWRMTKQPVIRNLMERGVLPTDSPDTATELTPKTQEDFKEQWNEWEDYCKQAGAMSTEMATD